MKKVISIIACLCLLVSMTVCTVSAGSAKIDFTDKANRTAYSTEQQIWAQNGITITNDKGASTSNVGDYGGEGYPARFYKSSTVKIECTGMSKLVINCVGLESKYVDGWANSIADSNATASIADGYVTIEFATPVDSFIWNELTAQSRAFDIVVNPGEGDDNNGGNEPSEPSEPAAPSANWEVATSLEAGVTYKLGLDQTAKAATYYFTGVMSGYYGATETDVALAVDMFVEIVDGGYKLFFNDASGAKNYIKLEQSGTHYNFTFGAEGSVFTLDAEKNALCAEAGDQICYMGTYGNYVTVGTLTTEKLKDTDYIARLYAQPKAPAGGDDTTTTQGTENTTTVAGEATTTTAPSTDVADKTEPMGENNTVIVLALTVMALACAGVVASKKRA